MLVPIQMGPNMAAGNQKKHLSWFCYKSINKSLKELNDSKLIKRSLSHKAKTPKYNHVYLEHREVTNKNYWIAAA